MTHAILLILYMHLHTFCATCVHFLIHLGPVCSFLLILVFFIELVLQCKQFFKDMPFY